jgi:large subunit ribosomal protein L23
MISFLDRFKKREAEKAVEKKEKKPKKVEPKTKKEKKEEKVKARIESGAYRILIRPQVSEKATDLGAENKYVFMVSKRATKKEIGQSIEDVYGVKPESIRTINVRGKKRTYGRTRGKTISFKKAIIKLPAGKTIQVYEGV